jgi:hypothetical protein
MAKHSSHILDMARKGAEHKYQELKTELAQLVKNFPHLAARAGGMASRGAAAVSRRGKAMIVAAGGEGLLPKPARRKMSAKARKAISDAQKKRWAAQKSASASAGAEPPARKAGKKR